MASLYYDAYQLIVREESSVLAFADLRGLRIAVAPTDSGQNRSFWFVARHFGLDADEVIALPMSEAAADFAMIHGQVDAVFRVRTPGNRAIRKLVGKHPMRIVPISQPEALALAQPSVSAGIIPIGSYRGYPPLPPEDLTTAVLERLLVVRADLDSDIVWDLTRVLFERRANLVAATKLAGFIRPLGDTERLPYPIHAGAQLYYNREKPGFLQQNARTLSGMLYVLAVLTSALVALRTRYVRARRVRMGNYNLELMDIAEQVRRTTSQEGLHAIKDHLVRILRRVVEDLDGERVTQDEFQHFSFTWQAVNTLVRDRLAQPPPASPAGVGDVASRGEP